MEINGSVNKPHFKIGGDVSPNDAARTTDNTIGSAPHFPANKIPKIAEHVPARELTRLQEQLSELETVRQDRVSQIKEKFASGFYSTPEAAEQTASAILSRFGHGGVSGGVQS